MPSPPLLSPYLQTRRFQAVKPFLTGDVLDLGCGHGELAAWLEPGQAYFGVEAEENRIADLRIRFPDRDFIARNLDNDSLNIDKQFDTITMIAVIEHLKNPTNLLSQLPALLRTTGRLVLTTPSPLGNRVHQLGARLGLFSRIAVDDHAMIYSPAPLSTLLAQFGFVVILFKRFLLGGNQLVVCELSQKQVPEG